MKGWELMLEGKNDGDRSTAHGVTIAALTLCFMSSECIILWCHIYDFFFFAMIWVYVRE